LTAHSAAADPTLLRLAARRQSVVSWSFAAAGLTLFFGYIALTASDLPLLRTTLPGTRSVSVAIALGYAMLMLTVLLTGLFLIVNERYVRPLLERLRAES